MCYNNKIIIKKTWYDGYNIDGNYVSKRIISCLTVCGLPTASNQVIPIRENSLLIKVQSVLTGYIVNSLLYL